MRENISARQDMYFPVSYCVCSLEKNHDVYARREEFFLFFLLFLSFSILFLFLFFSVWLFIVAAHGPTKFIEQTQTSGNGVQESEDGGWLPHRGFVTLCSTKVVLHSGGFAQVLKSFFHVCTMDQMYRRHVRMDRRQRKHFWKSILVCILAHNIRSGVSKKFIKTKL